MCEFIDRVLPRPDPEMELWHEMNYPERLRYATQVALGAVAIGDILGTEPIDTEGKANAFYRAHLDLLCSSDDPQQALQGILKSLAELRARSAQYTEKVEIPRRRLYGLLPAVVHGFGSIRLS